MGILRPGTPFLKRLRDLLIGTADPNDDTAPDWWGRIRKAIVAGIMGFVASGLTWLSAKTGGTIDLPLPAIEGIVTSLVGGLMTAIGAWLPWNRKPAA